MANVLIPFESDYNNRDIIFVKVGSTSLDDGNLILADTLDTTNTVGDNYSVYTPTQITDITAAKNPAIIAADEYYQDSDGNRINISDPTQITYSTGQIIRAYRLKNNAKFFLSDAGYTGTPVVGQYLIPAANTFEPAAAANLTTDPDFAFKVESIGQRYSFRGLNAITGVVIRVVRVDEE